MNVSNKAELAAYRDILVAINDNVARLKQQGRSLEEAIAANPTAAFDAKWGQFMITPALFTRLVSRRALALVGIVRSPLTVGEEEIV